MLVGSRRNVPPISLGDRLDATISLTSRETTSVRKRADALEQARRSDTEIVESTLHPPQRPAVALAWCRYAALVNRPKDCSASHFFHRPVQNCASASQSN